MLGEDACGEGVCCEEGGVLSRSQIQNQPQRGLLSVLHSEMIYAPDE